MKYQTKGSTVLFTNTSTNQADAASWAWYLDPDDGGGYDFVSSSPTTANITFPNITNKVCKVKLVATGPWGADVIFEDTYTTVTSVPAPVISTTSTPTFVSGLVTDFYFELTTGTGSGIITWAISDGSLPAGLTLNSSTGRLYGQCWKSGGAVSFQIRATDAQGRQAFRQITTTATLAAYSWHDAGQGITTNDLGGGDIRVSQWNNLISDRGAATNLVQATSSNQPKFISSYYNSLPAVQFDTDIKKMTHTPDTIYAVIYVMGLDVAADGVSHRSIHTNAGYGTWLHKDSLLYGTNAQPVSYFYGKTTPQTTPFIYTVASVASGGLYDNGILRGVVGPYYYLTGVAGTCLGAATTGYTLSAKMSMMEFGLFEYETLTKSRANSLIRLLAEKYNINYEVIP